MNHDDAPEAPLKIKLASQEVILRGKDMTLEEAEAMMLRNGAHVRSSAAHPHDAEGIDGRSLDDDYDTWLEQQEDA